MKRTLSCALLFSLLAALTFCPALAENRQQPQTDTQDVPVDESTYREEPSVPSAQPRLTDGQPGRGQIEDICDYWEQNGYPEDVSYAFEAGGEVKEDGLVYAYWQIGLVGADEARRQQILQLMSPQCLVTFYSCTFTHSQKTQAYQSLLQLAQQDENIRHVIFTRNTELVVVGVPEELEKDYAQLLIHQMGLGAVVSVTDERYIVTQETALTLGGDQGRDNHWAQEAGHALSALPSLNLGLDKTAQAHPTGKPALWLCLPVCFLALSAALWRINRRAQLLQTTQGTATRPVPLTRRQTVRLLRAAAHSPSPRLLEQLLNQLKKGE